MSLARLYRWPSLVLRGLGGAPGRIEGLSCGGLVPDIIWLKAASPTARSPGSNQAPNGVPRIFERSVRKSLLTLSLQPTMTDLTRQGRETPSHACRRSVVTLPAAKWACDFAMTGASPSCPQLPGPLRSTILSNGLPLSPLTGARVPSTQ